MEKRLPLGRMMRGMLQYYLTYVELSTVASKMSKAAGTLSSPAPLMLPYGLCAQPVAKIKSGPHHCHMTVACPKG